MFNKLCFDKACDRNSMYHVLSKFVKLQRLDEPSSFCVSLYALPLSIPVPSFPTFMCICAELYCVFLSSLTFCLLDFLFHQPRQPHCSASTPRPSSGACRPAPCRACWILTTSALGRNPLWLLWCTLSRRLSFNYRD